MEKTATTSQPTYGYRTCTKCGQLKYYDTANAATSKFYLRRRGGRIQVSSCCKTCWKRHYSSQRSQYPDRTRGPGRPSKYRALPMPACTCDRDYLTVPLQPGLSSEPGCMIHPERR